jgi:hypothetical protein
MEVSDMRHLLYDGWLPLLTSILVRHGMGATRRSVGGVPAEAQAKLEAVLQELLECLQRFRLFVMETDPIRRAMLERSLEVLQEVTGKKPRTPLDVLKRAEGVAGCRAEVTMRCLPAEPPPPQLQACYIHNSACGDTGGDGRRELEEFTELQQKLQRYVATLKAVHERKGLLKVASALHQWAPPPASRSITSCRIRLGLILSRASLAPSRRATRYCSSNL